MTGTPYAFPRLDLPDHKKDDKYHEQFARAIVNRSVDDSWRNSWTLMAELYKFLEEGSNGELVQHLQQADDGTALPAIWLSLNSIPTKIDLLTGELETRGYDIRVRAMNKEAVSRRQEEKERLRVKRRLQPLFAEADQQAGVVPGSYEYIPQTDQELNEYIDLSFKDKPELIMTGALQWTAKRNYWDDERRTLFRDLMAVNRMFVRNDIYRGIPRSSRVHPMNMIFDTSSKKDDLSDATYFGELDYIPLSSAVEIYNLSEDEIKKVYDAHQQFMGMTPPAETTAVSNYDYSFNTIGGKRLLWFKTVNGELRVLVARAVWRDFKNLNHKYEKDEATGAEFIQKVDRIRKRDNVSTQKIEVWRQATIIGGHIIRETGECPNQARSLDNLGTTEPPYKAWIPNYSTGRGVSKVEQLAQIQLYKDVMMYNMQLAVIRSGSRGISYDLAMKPDTMTIEQVMKYIKVFGITYYNSKDFQYLPGSNSSPFREFDMSMSDSVTKFVEIMQYLDSEMDKISGVSPERQGAVQGASQGLGVTQAAVFQSNLITQPYFIGFERFCSKVLNHQAKLIKIAWAGKEVFAPIIGDVGVDFLKDNIDLELEDFDVFVESIPPLLQDRAKFEQLLMIVVQSDPDFIDDAIQILSEPDLKVAIRKFQRKRALKKAFEAKQQEAQQQQQDALQERLQRMQAQTQQQQIQGNLASTHMKNETNLQKTAMTGRVKLSSDKIKALAKLAEISKQSQQTNNSDNGQT
jgi:hypothetical protein